jgi:hypothetical protein
MMENEINFAGKQGTYGSPATPPSSDVKSVRLVYQKGRVRETVGFLKGRGRRGTVGSLLPYKIDSALPSLILL